MSSLKLLVTSAVLVSAVSFLQGASVQPIPDPPPPQPLGLFVRDAKTIHLLQVTAVTESAITFKTQASLKGKAEQVPFSVVLPSYYDGYKDLFRAGQLVLCFGQDEMATLHVGGRWVYAVRSHVPRSTRPLLFAPVYSSFVLLMTFNAGVNGVIFDGATSTLRDAVCAILDGRTLTITARMPQARHEPLGRRCRIKAGPTVTDFVLSDESPYFVGWSSGAPDEAIQLAQLLRDGTMWERTIAATDLAHLGTAARPAWPVLRHALRSTDPAVVCAAALTLAHLDPKADDALEALRLQLNHADVKVRAGAALGVGELGPGAQLFPELLRLLHDKEPQVRAAAAIDVAAVGSMRPTEAAAALLLLLQQEQNNHVRVQAVNGLQHLGPRSWTAFPTLRQLATQQHDTRFAGAEQALNLLARFDPPPVETLAAVLEQPATPLWLRETIATRLSTFGPRAWPALPALHRVLQEPETEPIVDWTTSRLRLEVAAIILQADPAKGALQVMPVLRELLTKSGSARSALCLLGKCGNAARPMLPTLLGTLQPEDAFAPLGVRSLLPLLGLQDRKLMLTLRPLVSGQDGDPLTLARALWRVGDRVEALIEAGRCLDGEYPYRKAEAMRWLAQLGRAALPLKPILRQSLERATGGERARLALTVWRMHDPGTLGPTARSLTALEELLTICEGESPLVGRISQHTWWSWDMSSAGRQEDRDVGAAVSTVLTQLLRSDNPVPVLEQVMRDPSPHLRLVATIALARAEPRSPGIVFALQRLLSHHPHFFVYAADTLAALGPSAAPLGPQLMRLQQHDNLDVLLTMRRVLRRIDPLTAAQFWGAAGTSDAVPTNLEPLWDDLAGRDALRADLALWRLAGAGSAAVALLRDRLRPPPIPDTEHIARLLADLDSRNFAVREKASARLLEHVEAAAPALRKALAAGPSLEMRRRIEAILVGLDPERTPEQRRRMRALRLLEELGSAEARALLTKLSRGDPRLTLTQGAADALRRLE